MMDQTFSHKEEYLIREEVTKMGFLELKTVDDVLESFKSDKYFLFINSTCPNSTNARKILSDMKIPDNSYTVFAGIDKDATAKARELLQVKPSSPAFYIVEQGKVVLEIDRDYIRRNPSEFIKDELLEAFKN